jgi:hypothetical protein
MRAWSVIFGIGLVILWLTGLSTPNSAAWFTWLDGVGAVLSFIVAGTIRDVAHVRRVVSGPISLSIALFALWIVGLATNAASWQAWWTFVFACGFLLLGIAGGRAPRAVRPGETVTRHPEEERFRRGA